MHVCSPLNAQTNALCLCMCLCVTLYVWNVFTKIRPPLFDGLRLHRATYTTHAHTHNLTFHVSWWRMRYIQVLAFEIYLLVMDDLGRFLLLLRMINFGLNVFNECHLFVSFVHIIIDCLVYNGHALSSPCTSPYANMEFDNRWQLNQTFLWLATSNRWQHTTNPIHPIHLIEIESRVFFASCRSRTKYFINFLNLNTESANSCSHSCTYRNWNTYSFYIKVLKIKSVLKLCDRRRTIFHRGGRE